MAAAALQDMASTENRCFFLNDYDSYVSPRVVKLDAWRKNIGNDLGMEERKTILLQVFRSIEGTKVDYGFFEVSWNPIVAM